MSEKLRLDKWLWYARFFKTRSLAAAQIETGRVRVNSAHVAKRSHAVGPGDVLTFPQGRAIRVIQVEALGLRRGPSTEAAGLYTDLSPPEAAEKEEAPRAPGFEGKGRPTKRDRRRLDLSRTRSLE